ncbi:MAG: AmmeMemoRadiSam system protein B [Planctomycetota bacterium]|nr:AmmeMemoRadiSam system protein B [Planctomycetota bacterium]
MASDSEHDRHSPGGAALKPRLRPVEVQPHPDDTENMVLLRDPSALADGVLSMSLPALRVVSLMDGEHTCDQIREKFLQQTGQALPSEMLDKLLQALEESHFLEGAAFDGFYSDLVRDYQEAPTRPMNPIQGLGLDGGDLHHGLEQMFSWQTNGQSRRPIAGLIAPHLDYPRGQPCYQEAYAILAGQTHFERFVILGTNHFGRSTSVVATAKDFETPLGISAVDVPFLEQIEERCGQSIRKYEFDHQREHSLELQVLLLQHLFRTGSFRIVPVICPSPCGPTGTAPFDGDGVDLKDFAETLGHLIQEDDTPTCIIAGADLSHIGRFFGDTVDLSDELLSDVRERDEAALAHLQTNDPETFRRSVAAADNPTRICSAGCIYALMTALPEIKPRLLKYHQAVNHEMQCAVTCAAAVFEAS